LEYEALRDVQGILPISPGLLDELEEHLIKDPTTSWTHCHSAAGFLYMMNKLLPGKIGVDPFHSMASKTKIALWIQTKQCVLGTKWTQKRQVTTLDRCSVHCQHLGYMNLLG
jgi:hypothetical protein